MSPVLMISFQKSSTLIGCPVFSTKVRRTPWTLNPQAPHLSKLGARRHWTMGLRTQDLPEVNISFYILHLWGFPSMGVAPVIHLLGTPETIGSRTAGRTGGSQRGEDSTRFVTASWDATMHVFDLTRKELDKSLSWRQAMACRWKNRCIIKRWMIWIYESMNLWVWNMDEYIWI